MSNCATAFFLTFLTVTVTTTTFCFQDLETVTTQIVEAKNWVQSSLRLHGLGPDSSDNIGVALSDCAKLYEDSESRMAELVANKENYTAEDGGMWLSGVLANHRTCLDGLSETGFVDQTHTMAPNITVLIGEALSMFAKGRGTIRRGVAPRPIYSNNGGLLASWTPATSKADFVVATDGSGTHRTIKDAVAALNRMGRGRIRRAIIYVKAGIYNERVEIQRHIKNLMLVGDGMDRTIITSNQNVVDGSTTVSSATFRVSGDGFWARDITFENTAGPHKHQAVALMVSSDHSIFYRCGIRGYQDTLYAHSLRQFYRDCHIYGTIDFIFGDAAAVLQNCDIFVRRPMNSQANMITAQGRDDPNENTGISVHGSRVRPSPDFIGVMNSYRTYLGRPWRKYSRTVFIKTDLDGLIDPKGWTAWSSNFALSTLYYAEYLNTGVGAATVRRVKWPGFHVLNSAAEASAFTVSRFLQGETWIPESGVPFELGV